MKTCIIGLTALATLALPLSAQAQGRACGERTAIIERLESGYGETRTAAGLSTQSGMIEIFASEETGTWTIIMTMPTGQSCLMAAGNSWDSDPAQVTKSGMPI